MMIMLLVRAAAFAMLDHLEECDVPFPSPLPSMNALAKQHRPGKFGYVTKNRNQAADLLFTHTSYQRIYPTYMEPYRRKRFQLLELGLAGTASINLWLSYFPCAVIHGVDLFISVTVNVAGRNVTTHKVDTSNVQSLENLVQRTGRFDVIVDDAGHHVSDQLTAYSWLFENGLTPGGLYIIEDIETSYWQPGQRLYGSRLRGASGCSAEAKRHRPSTVDTFRDIIDAPINGKFSDHQRVVTGPRDHWVRSVAFAQNVIILTKKDEHDCFAEGPYVWAHKLEKSCGKRACQVAHVGAYWGLQPACASCTVSAVYLAA